MNSSFSGCVRSQTKTVPSHHWVQQILMGQQDLGPPVGSKDIQLALSAHNCHKWTHFFEQAVTRLELASLAISYFRVKSIKVTSLFIDALRQICFAYSCTVISSCTFWSFLTNCSLKKKKQSCEAPLVIDTDISNILHNGIKRRSWWTYSVTFRPRRTRDAPLPWHSLKTWRTHIAKCTRGARITLYWQM